MPSNPQLARSCNLGGGPPGALKLESIDTCRDLAFVFWKEYKFPVRSALTAAMLYRNLAEKTEETPHVGTSLRTGLIICPESFIPCDGIARTVSQTLHALLVILLEIRVCTASGRSQMDLRMLPPPGMLLISHDHC